MPYNAKNCTIQIDNTTMDYISFGSGSKNLVIIPGLGDALKTVKGTAFSFSLLYKLFAKNYKVYVFSRKNKLKQGCSTRDMAADLAAALHQLYITDACVMGVSQGGMIAQHLAIDYPELVKKLVLAVTACAPNETSKSVISHWLALAAENNFYQIFADTAEKTYTEAKLKLYRPFYGVLSKLSAPKNLDRFILQATACLNHNALEGLSKIKCPTLVIGGDNDKIVGGFSCAQLAGHIAQSKLKIYSGLGHGTYEEAPDFNRRVLTFFDN
ncbi:MAG: alpha/beta hydrolase [Oscillospiraceae bacterium]|nr:alpha/beta hydrolase [Oscillospiraceae bacterium]